MGVIILIYRSTIDNNESKVKPDDLKCPYKFYYRNLTAKKAKKSRK